MMIVNKVKECILYCCYDLNPAKDDVKSYNSLETLMRKSLQNRFILEPFTKCKGYLRFEDIKNLLFEDTVS